MEKLVYKTTGDAKLELHIFKPEGWTASDSRCGIVFFFGGGWRGGRLGQFHPQSEALAKRGMVAICAEYRVKERHGSDPFDSVEDGISAMRYVRTHAAEFGLDENRIAAGGGSAGGHVAACTAILPHLHAKDESTDVRSTPDALVLFNPVNDLTDNPGLVEGWDLEPEALCPTHHMKEGLPPCLVMHGTIDKTVSHASAERFVRLAREKGNDWEFDSFEGGCHGFFNNSPWFERTYKAAEAFLQRIGYVY